MKDVIGLGRWLTLDGQLIEKSVATLWGLHVAEAEWESNATRPRQDESVVDAPQTIEDNDLEEGACVEDESLM